MGAVSSSVFVCEDEIYETVDECPVNQPLHIRYVIKDWMGNRTILPVNREVEYLHMQTVAMHGVQLQYPLHRHFIKCAKGKLHPIHDQENSLACCYTVMQTHTAN